MLFVFLKIVFGFDSNVKICIWILRDPKISYLDSIQLFKFAFGFLFESKIFIFEYYSTFKNCIWIQINRLEVESNPNAYFKGLIEPR